MSSPALSRLGRGGGFPAITVLDQIAKALKAPLTVSMMRARAPDRCRACKAVLPGGRRR
jgi:hypothetical protein